MSGFFLRYTYFRSGFGRLLARLLYLLYSALGTCLYLILLFFFPLIRLWGGRIGYGLEQRLGRYTGLQGNKTSGQRNLWIHASSVGEAQAAMILITELLHTLQGVQVILTSSTEQGNRVARNRLSENVTCLMAPLDTPAAVKRAVQAIRPDLYICLETELWPVLLTEVRQAAIPMLLLNGRLSERSFERYRRIHHFMRSLLNGFQSIAVITEADGRRFAGLGVATHRIQVCGNLKYDMPAERSSHMRALHRKRLGVADQVVFMCGSTHEGEEALLLPVFQQLAASAPLVWVVAPRHLERLPAVQDFFRRSGLLFDRYSELATKTRSAAIVLLDTMGDLADLYCGGDYIFCGGSLVERGGHNVMEAARWGRPVYFGPHMKDFRDAADLLIAGGGGFQVQNAEALATVLQDHLNRPEAYQKICAKAATIAAQQRGAVERQAGIVRQLLIATEKEAGATAFFC
jgi:3-deoxy-D-manno-octulosonic-acid transferase